MSLERSFSFGRVVVLFCLLIFASSALRALPAFPGAEGFGANATGGRGGEVYVVTNLNDTGPGSFRDAVSQPNRTVVFAVGGVIEITSRIIVAPNITIAGQTAPGEGITIYGNGLSFSNANNTVTRYLRIRMGVGGDSGKDAVTIAEGHDMMFDHVSVSWGRDETFSISGDVRNVTIQDSIIAQGLQTHSAGGLIQTDGGVSILRTLYIANHTRNPKVKGVNDFVNNVVYNWGGGGAYILGDSAGPSYANIVHNLFIDGPQTSVAPFTRGNLNFHVYVAQNVHDGNRNGVLDGAPVPMDGYTTVDFQAERYPYPSVSYLLSPDESFDHVGQYAGASLARDRVDRHLIDTLQSLGTAGEIISNENDAPIFGPGPVAGGRARPDRDADGLPDAWEIALGLNPDAPDQNGDPDGDGYTHLEEYLNALADAAVARVSVDAIAPDTGTSDIDGITSENRVTLHGRASPGASVSVRRVGVGTLGTVTANPDGTWSYDYSGTALPEGLHAFTATATESSGWTSPPSRGFFVTVDTAVPEPAVITSVSRADVVQVHGSAEPGAIVVVSLDGSAESATAVADDAGLWLARFTVEDLPPGAHRLVASVSDAAGNLGPASDGFVVDSRLRAPTIDAITEDTGSDLGDFVTRDRSLVLHGSADPGAQVEISRAGSGVLGTTEADASGNWTFDHTSVELDAGEHLFSATASVGDATSFASLPRSVIIDLEPPRVASIRRQHPASSATIAGDLVFRVTFSEAIENLDASDFVPATSGTTGTVGAVQPVGEFVYDVAVNGVTGEGTVRVDLRASGTDVVDRAGNVIAAGFTAGESYTIRLPGSGVWIASDSGAWTDAGNWELGAVAGGLGATADFANVEIEEELSVQTDAGRTIGHLVFGDLDASTPANVRLTSDGALNLAVAAGAPSITVNPLGSDAAVKLDLRLESATGLRKLGAGMAVLTRENAVAGPLQVERGVLRIEDGADLNATSVDIGNAGSQLQVAGGEFHATEQVMITAGGRSGIDVSGGVARFDGGILSSNARDALVRVTGGELITPRIEFPRTNDRSISFAVGLVVQGGEARVGTIALGTANSWGTMSVEGGALLVEGPVFVGWQETAGRGGRMRVTGGTFTVADIEQGLVLARNPGAQPNNVASAEFTGGTSTLGRVTLGYDATSTAGSATFTLNGGTVYLGAGGIVARGTGAFAAHVELVEGILGAAESWSSDVAMTLPAENDVVIRTADADGQPHDITLAGALSGAGNLRKQGGGTLTLAGDNSFTGTTTVEGGTVRIQGERSAGSAWVMQDGSGLAFGLGAAGQSDRLILSGGFIRGGTGPVQVHFTAGDGVVPGETYTLATFDHTTFTAADFVATGLPPGTAAEFVVSDGSLSVTIVGSPVFVDELRADGQVGEPFAYTLTANHAPRSFSAAGLPEGLALDESTGIISGTPLAAGTFEVGVTATNAAGTGAATLTLVIAKASASIGFDDLVRSYDGGPHAVDVTTVPEDLAVNVTYNGGADVPWLPGHYTVTATVDDPDFAGVAEATLVIVPTVQVREGLTLQGVIEGSAQLFEPRDAILNGGARLSGDLLVPGQPILRIYGASEIAGVRDGTGPGTPTHHQIVLNGGSRLRHVVRRVEAADWAYVPMPAAPTGTRNVVVNRPGQSIGDAATMRNLTLNGNAGAIEVPPGAYGTFIANGGGTLVLGIAGAMEPAVYELQQLTLNGGASIRIVGPVLLRLARGTNLNGSIGALGQPAGFRLEVSQGDVVLNSGASVTGDIIAPRGTLTLNGSATVSGRIRAERLQLNGGSQILDPEL